MQLKASAPGSLMLLGEYAVLHDKSAVVCAIDKRITITLTPREDQRIEIQSHVLGNYSTHVSMLQIEKPFQFVLGVLQRYQAKLKQGFDIHIHSEFSHEIGFGSSAAVTVALLAALTKCLDIEMTSLDLVREGREVIRAIQGVGSGADIAASVYGGIVNYLPNPLTIEKAALLHPLTVLYSGFKTKTVDAIQQVQQRFASMPQLYEDLCLVIGQCAIEGFANIQQGNWSRVGVIMDLQQGIMESLGVSLPILRTMLDELHAQPSILGAKISGSGLGDCVIGLGYVENFNTNVKNIPVAMTLQGVECEKI